MKQPRGWASEEAAPQKFGIRNFLSAVSKLKSGQLAASSRFSLAKPRIAAESAMN
jgi:hypothetical protein